MYRSLMIDMLHVTEVAARAAAAYTGRGDEAGAAQAAAQAMHAGLAAVPVDARVALGVAEHDADAELLHTGEVLGTGKGPSIDIAVAPLEGPSICANGGPNALSIVVAAAPDTIMKCPNVRMDKIAAGPGTGFLDLDRSARDNLTELAQYKGCTVEDLTVVVLYRPRHESLIKEIRGTGARVRLISDGDVAAALATTKTESDIDVLMGSGGALQGILTAAALRCLGGSMQTRLRVADRTEAELCRQAGIDDLDRKYEVDDLVGGELVFVATAITDGDYLAGIRSCPPNTYSSESLVLSSEDPTVRVVHSLENRHR